jgi:UDP-N-acetylglucosamine 2-epimerase (non-hydrolysing)
MTTVTSDRTQTGVVVPLPPRGPGTVKILVPVGTRPEIIKLAPVILALKARGFDVTTVATGQHYDVSLTGSFELLGIRPDARWQVTGTEGDRFGTILRLAYEHIAATRPDLVLLLGDTYTVPLFCLAARHYQVPIAHIEAGMRSFNQTSIEESNRRMAGAVASLHFAPTESDAGFLAAEGVAAARIRVVGNPVIDAIRQLGLPRVAPARREGIVVTVHRRSNVEEPQRLAAVVELVSRLSDQGESVTFPVHPRTRARLEDAGAVDLLEQRGVRLLPPLPYQEMLERLSAARVIVTDSGGLQEEGAWFGVPVVVLRRSTPRWDGVRAGIAVLCGLDVDLAVAAVRQLSTPAEQERVAAVACPYGDGHAGSRMAELLTRPDVLALLQLEEPDFVGFAAPDLPAIAR